eukprot:TRINITY_DN101400_c0_g1_i1.p1 TRINITY_DN101400_c0_g1~~TRINITY_DN101400_c0_g1_i1.p1  ORF type:complete len:217 (-),score=6.68 TRINITY_DN101400_c0_g1_i1:39-689(-)
MVTMSNFPLTLRQHVFMAGVHLGTLNPGNAWVRQVLPGLCRWRRFCSWQVSSLGRVKDSRGHIHAGTPRVDGYRQVSVPVNGVHRTRLVHRLVAFNFLPLPRDWARLIVHHRDSCRENNRADNLQLVTAKENIQYAWQSRRTRGQTQKLAKSVLARQTGGEWMRYPSARAASQALYWLQTDHGCWEKVATTSFGFSILPGSASLPHKRAGKPQRRQ